jgi:hypothetical protein
MRQDRRRLGLVPALGVLTACGITFGLAGCGAAAEGAARFGSGDSTLISDSTGEPAAPTADCPKVADRLPDVRVSDTVKRGVARGLGLLEIQVADADRRLGATVDRADPGAAQRAVLSSLANQRAATIQRIADAIGSAADRPEGLDALATCTLSGAETAATPAPSALPSDPPTDLPTDLPPDFPTDLPTDFSIDDLPSDFPSDLATALAGGLDDTQPAKAKKSAKKSAASPSPSPSAAPGASASASPTVADAVTVDCPPVAAALRIPSDVKSDVAVQLGLLELRSANANRRLAGQNTDQNTVLNDLERDRTTIVRRIETILTQADDPNDPTGGAGDDLGGLTTCQVNGGVLIDNNGSTDTAPTTDPIDDPADGQNGGQNGGSADDDTWFASADPGAGAGYGAN